NHWNKDWKKANLEAAKVVEQMFERVEQGMIVVAKTISERQSNNNNDNTSSFFMQIHDHKVEKKQFGEYWIHVIKGKTIILDNVNIDGNMYVVNCEIQCKTNVHITTQVFVTNNGLVDQHCVNPIQWNTKFHHDIPLLLQNLQDQSNNCSKSQLFDGAIEMPIKINSNITEQLHDMKMHCIYLDVFGTVHAHTANSFYNLGNACINKGEYNKAIESYQKALKLYLEIFGRNHADVAESYNNLGCAYDDKGQYDEAVECYEMSLKIRKEISCSNAIHSMPSSEPLPADHYTLLQPSLSPPKRFNSIQRKKGKGKGKGEKQRENFFC
ncbi:hypothetical protein RFI_39812, partial [Reticulomyxa filosa]